jgi:gas vesicle protein
MRILLSVVIGFLELIRGDWQKSVLTLFGVYSSTALVIGLFGKILRNAWLFMAPDLQRQLRDDIFKSSKSVFVGFLLWSFSVFSPKLIRIAVNNSFEQMQTLVENFNEKAQQVQDKAQAAVGAAGISVSFPKIPLDVVPNMDDIQNLQTIAKIPAVYCSPEFQKILEPVLLVPPLRLIVELLNIPTIEEDKKAACAAVKPGGLADSVADLVTPEVGVIPGGPMNTASKVAEIAEDPSAAIANAVDEKKEEMKEAIEKEEPVTGSVKNKVAAIEKKIAATKKAAKGGARNGKKKRNRKTRRKTRK